jgi:hypothetical protein
MLDRLEYGCIIGIIDVYIIGEEESMTQWTFIFDSNITLEVYTKFQRKLLELVGN